MPQKYDLAIFSGSTILYGVLLPNVIPNLSRFTAIVNSVALPVFAYLLTKLVPYMSEKHPNKNLIVLAASIFFAPPLFTLGCVKSCGQELSVFPLLFHTLILFVFFVLMGSFYVIKAYDEAYGHSHRKNRSII